jgi:hypothetical protein
MKIFDLSLLGYSASGSSSSYIGLGTDKGIIDLVNIFRRKTNAFPREEIYWMNGQIILDFNCSDIKSNLLVRLTSNAGIKIFDLLKTQP